MAEQQQPPQQQPQPQPVPQQQPVPQPMPQMPLPQAIANPGIPVPVQQGNTSLYVGDLSPDVTEANLFEVFSAVGAIASIRVCRDSNTRRSLGYAYVNYMNPTDADRAMDTLNYSAIKGIPCRIMWSQRDPTTRRTGSGNIFIKNLSKNIDQKALADTFSMFGNILSCKVVEDELGSKGYGFVHFETQVAADAAIEKVNGKILAGQKVFVGHFVSKKERGSEEEVAPKFNNLFVKSLPAEYDDEKLKALFAPFGAIISSIVMKTDAGVSKEFGFVCFENPDDAKKALEEMNDKEVDGKNIIITQAQKKAERSANLRNKFEQERLSKPQGVNLYVKNLEDTVDDDQLRSVFAPYGTITSARVMRDDKGASKGFGFVCFSSPDEATAAVTAVNGQRVGNKPLYVALAQRKDERTQQLTQQYSQRQPGLRLQGPPPLFAMQAPPMIPYGQPMMAKPPRWGAAGARGAQPGPYGPMGYVGVPMQQQRPRGPPGARGGMRGTPRVMQQQQRPPQRGFKYAPGVRNVQMPGMPVMQQGMPPNANMGGAMFSAQEPLTATMLASANHETQKRMLGERLFPIIRSTNPEDAHKITGMLLEMDNSELLHLLEAPEALQQKVAEAEVVLAQHRNKQKDEEVSPAGEAPVFE